MMRPQQGLTLDRSSAASEVYKSQVQALLNVPVIDMMRPKEALFKELGLSNSDDDATLFAAMAENPRLIERPIVLANGKAALGRPPEAALDIL